MFSDVLARFPGSVHDSRIWKISGIGMHVENTFSIGEHILGDSSYMLRPYLLTPYRQPTHQSNYNYAHQSGPWVDGSWVMGQMGHVNRWVTWVMGHGSVTHDP